MINIEEINKEILKMEDNLAIPSDISQYHNFIIGLQVMQTTCNGWAIRASIELDAVNGDVNRRKRLKSVMNRADRMYSHLERTKQKLNTIINKGQKFEMGGGEPKTVEKFEVVSIQADDEFDDLELF